MYPFLFILILIPFPHLLRLLRSLTLFSFLLLHVSFYYNLISLIRYYLSFFPRRVPVAFARTSLLFSAFLFLPPSLHLGLPSPFNILLGAPRTCLPPLPLGPPLPPWTFPSPNGLPLPGTFLHPLPLVPHLSLGRCGCWAAWGRRRPPAPPARRRLGCCWRCSCTRRCPPSSPT